MIYDKKFNLEVDKRVKNFSKNKKLQNSAKNFNIQASLSKYSYNFSWADVPVIQLPADLILMQELIFKVKPDLIIETGIARGGSLIFYSTILSLIKKKYKVIGIDVDIRKHAKKVLFNHKFAKNIISIEGSSVENKTLEKILKLKKKYKKILVCLDSNHVHSHVIQELNLYSKLVSKNSYIVVFDSTSGTFDKKNMKKISQNYNYKPFGIRSNPLTAIKEFSKKNKNFIIDETYHNKGLITNCYKGFLKRVK